MSKNSFSRIIRAMLQSAFLIVFSLAALSPIQGNGQDTLQWSDFRDPGDTWSHAGEVSADPNGKTLVAREGTGILVNNPSKENRGKDLYSKAEYGDIDIALEFMMAPGSNSGLYLQGRYEIQLMDSWGVENPKSGDNGGIYQRWDESKPDGQKGFEGYAPKQNASKPAGQWQQLFVSFRAPRFDAKGNKTANARILRVELNGVLIHENVELSGPTRAGLDNNEKPRGPLRIQGDHGPVALCNIVVTSLGGAGAGGSSGVVGGRAYR